MNPKDLGRAGSGNFFRKQLFTLPLLALICALVTGCPHNEYTVELKPMANGIERTLTFYRADGSETNGTPKYENFSTSELAAITKLYPAGAMVAAGKKCVARGVFTNDLPSDVGGNGHFTNFVTSLGSACYYLERFRGTDDLVAHATNQFAAADQLTDLVVGWAKTEFSHERGWKNLRKFLNDDFRHDLKNAGLYFWAGSAVALTDTNAPEEFIARFSQYLLERGYVQPADLWLLSAQNCDPVLRLVQRLAARKLNIPESGLLPQSLKILTNSASLAISWTNYLAGTDLYRTKIKEWEKERKLNPEAKRPSPDEAIFPLISKLLAPVNLFQGDTPDQLTVRLAVTHAPEHSNGKWQDGYIEWKATLEANRALPVVCYANWTQLDETFQKVHFGEVLIKGEELIDYCLWFHSLSPAQAAEWEAILAEIQTSQGFEQKLKALKNRQITGFNIIEEHLHP